MKSWGLLMPVVVK